MWQAIKTAAGTIWVYIKQVPSALKATPGFLDKGIRMGLGTLSQLVTGEQGLNVGAVSGGWDTWREHFAYGGMPSESSGKEPFSHATYSMENRPKTAPLVDMTYKAGITLLLTAAGVGLVLLMGPAAIIPLGIILGVATLLRVTGHMDPKLYKLLATGLMGGLMIAAMVGLTVLFPPLLALPLIGGALAMMTSVTSLAVMFGLSLLVTAISGLLDDGLRGVGRALFNLVKFPFNVTIYGLSAMASFTWDAFWWPFHGLNRIYDKVSNKVQEWWPNFTGALSKGWGGLTAGVMSLGAWLQSRLGTPKVEIQAEIDDVENENEFELSDDEDSDLDGKKLFDGNDSYGSDDELLPIEEKSEQPLSTFGRIRQVIFGKKESKAEVVNEGLQMEDLDKDIDLENAQVLPQDKLVSDPPNEVAEKPTWKARVSHSVSSAFKSVTTFFHNLTTDTKLEAGADKFFQDNPMENSDPESYKP